MLQTDDGNSIMVVDDKPANLKLLERMLSDRGYRVRPFLKSPMALNVALNDPPDLILLDINMPDMDGFEMCRRLKADARTGDIPVIFISALSETFDKIKAFVVGGVDYVTKPFQFEEVYARVKTHLNLKRVQRMVEEKNQLLEKTISDLKIAQKQLVQSEKMAALGVLTAGIAHEINNPVNFIKTSAVGLEQDIKDIERLLAFYKENCSRCNKNDVIRQGLESIKKEIDFDLLIRELPELMHNLQEGVNRTQEIVSSLRLYSRMDDFDFKKTGLHSLIDAALVILKSRQDERIEVRKEYGAIPEIYGHPGKLIQVFTNIISNAIDSLQTMASGLGQGMVSDADNGVMPDLGEGVISDSGNAKADSDKKRITIRTSVVSKENRWYTLVSIHDNGPGIAKQYLDKIFDPFFTTKDIGRGSGLGLSISIGIVREHNGIIEVISNPESGTVFSVLLPVEEEKS